MQFFNSPIEQIRDGQWSALESFREKTVEIVIIGSITECYTAKFLRNPNSGFRTICHEGE